MKKYGSVRNVKEKHNFNMLLHTNSAKKQRVVSFFNIKNFFTILCKSMIINSNPGINPNENRISIHILCGLMPIILSQPARPKPQKLVALIIFDLMTSINYSRSSPEASPPIKFPSSAI